MTNPSTNPLHIPEILEIILSNLSQEHLFDARLVCTDWEIAASKVLGSQSVVSFYSSKEVEEYLVFFSNNPTLLHQNVKFVKPDANDPIYEKFLSVFGGQILTLCAIPETFMNVHSDNIKKYCTKLTTLVLLKHDDCQPQQINNLDTTAALLKLPKNLPNLKELVLGLQFVNNSIFDKLPALSNKLTRLVLGDSNTDLLTDFPYQLKLNELRHLKTLAIQACLKETDFIALGECEFKLEEFNSGMNNTSPSQSTFFKFMDNQKESLVKLSITGSRNCAHQTCPGFFPRMKKLEYLRIMYFGPISLLVWKFPSLTYLELINHVPHYETFFPKYDGFCQSEFPAHNLKTFFVSICKMYSSTTEGEGGRLSELFRNIGALAPNLETLSVISTHLTNDDLQALFKSMKNLQNISFTQPTIMKFYEVSDASFTGQYPNGHRCRSFRNLKNLGTLRFDEARYVTDSSITNGLSKCKNLKNLLICSRAFTGLALKSLADNLTDLKELNFGARYEAEMCQAVEYFQNKHPDTYLHFTVLSRQNF